MNDFDDFDDFERWDYFYCDDEDMPQRKKPVPHYTRPRRRRRAPADPIATGIVVTALLVIVAILVFG